MVIIVELLRHESLNVNVYHRKCVCLCVSSNIREKYIFFSCADVSTDTHGKHVLNMKKT